MMPHLPLSAKIAFRYLVSKKSHSAVNIISVVSICGVAIATMAIVCVLSVFNGFQDVLGGKLDLLAADVKVTPAKGKVIEDADSLLSVIKQYKEVEMAMPSIEENALAVYERRQLPIVLKGVDEVAYKELTSIEEIVKEDGAYRLVVQPDLLASEISTEEVEELDESALFAYADELYSDLSMEITPEYSALISVGAAVSLRAYPGEKRIFQIFTPRRMGVVNLGNPAASFMCDSLAVSGVFQSDQSEYDENMVIVDIALAKKLFQYDKEASAIELKLTNPDKGAEFVSVLSGKLGTDYVVKDRLQQQELQFKMINIEKWVTFLLLTFILLIASFNIVSTMSMLIVEKEDSIQTLRRLGATKANIANIFRWESCYVSIAGAVAGVILGLILCLIQQHFGIIKLNGEEGNLIISAYPVKVLFSDVVIVLLPVILVGLLTAGISGNYAKSKIAA